MVIQVVNFNLEGITHEQYLGAASEVAPAFNDLKGVPSSASVYMRSTCSRYPCAVSLWPSRKYQNIAAMICL